jgi:hypothetical protein
VSSSDLPPSTTYTIPYPTLPYPFLLPSHNIPTLHPRNQRHDTRQLTESGGGLWQPDAAQLSALRREIDRKPHKLKRVLGRQGIRKTFLGGVGEDEERVVEAFVGSRNNASTALKRNPKVCAVFFGVCPSGVDSWRVLGCRGALSVVLFLLWLRLRRFFSCRMVVQSADHRRRRATMLITGTFHFCGCGASRLAPSWATTRSWAQVDWSGFAPRLATWSRL